MILPIGNKQYSVDSIQQSGKNKKLTTDCRLQTTHKAGFSFFEVMITVAILSFGLIMICQAFLTSLNTFSYYLTHLQVQSWANEKIWEVSDSLVHENFLDGKETSGNFVIGSKDITWEMEIKPIDEKEKFFQLGLVLFWQEGKRKVKVRRDAYAGI